MLLRESKVRLFLLFFAKFPVHGFLSLYSSLESAET